MTSVVLTQGFLLFFVFGSTTTTDSVKLTGADETTDKLWGEGKANPKTTLEENGFLMKRMILSHEQANRLKRRGGRGRRYGGKKKSSDNTPVINA
mmetsp:Transcript_17373/g.42214  ORF Transcript_17373/g.42214 Transcript_17373/m.42214 type:complete len:95 (+) Transcript_17373:1103-1387(+)